MCMFCAAVPFALASGVAASAKRKEKIKAALASGSPLPRTFIHPILRPERLTVLATGGLLCGSVIYHTTVAPLLGVW